MDALRTHEASDVRLLRGPFVAPHVWVTDRALKQLALEANLHAPLETGGLLLGYWSSASGEEEVLIELIIGPGTHAQHERTRFRPDAPWQRRQLAAAYAASGRITTYLGDWHTHPGSAPAPSRRDRKTARTIAYEADARVPRPLMLILGSGSDAAGWTPRLHLWDRRRLHEVAIGRVRDRPPLLGPEP